MQQHADRTKVRLQKQNQFGAVERLSIPFMPGSPPTSHFTCLQYTIPGDALLNEHLAG